MQELFILRRSLEMALADESNKIAIDRQQNWLARVETVHQSLEQLSHELAPPYVQENLSLAIQYHLKQWQRRYPDLQVHAELGTDDPSQQSQQNGEILQILQEVLELTLPKLSPRSLQIHLKSRDYHNQMQVQLTCANPVTLTSDSLQNIKCLGQTFQLLTAGWCSYYCKNSAMIWSFHWRSR